MQILVVDRCRVATARTACFLFRGLRKLQVIQGVLFRDRGITKYA
jgi:hypothetical protein